MSYKKDRSVLTAMTGAMLFSNFYSLVAASIFLSTISLPWDNLAVGTIYGSFDLGDDKSSISDLTFRL